MTEGRNAGAVPVEGWRATYLAHRPVVNARAGETLGKAIDIVFDPQARELAGLLIQPAGRDGVLEIARRTFGGTMGLTYIALDHIIALDADVITVDLEPGVTPRERPRHPLPRLAAVTGFAVISLRGKRLGHLADLLLDADGRHITGYLVDSSGCSASQPAPLFAPTGAAPEESSLAQRGPLAVEAASGPAQAASMLVIPADQEVRIGRDLIIVAGPRQPDRGEQAEFSPDSIGDARNRTTDAPTWQPWESDAPTQQITR